MACCGNKQPTGYNQQSYAPVIPYPNNSAMQLQLAEQQRQQAEIRKVIEQSSNPNKTLIKTYR